MAVPRSGCSMMRPTWNSHKKAGKDQVLDTVASHGSVRFKVLRHAYDQRKFHELRGLNAEASDADPALGAEGGFTDREDGDEQE